MRGGAINRTALVSSLAASASTTFSSFELSAGARYQVSFMTAANTGNNGGIQVDLTSSIDSSVSRSFYWPHSSGPAEFLARANEDEIEVTNLTTGVAIRVSLIERMG